MKHELVIPSDARHTRVCILFRDRFLRGIFVEDAEVNVDDARETVTVARTILGPGVSLPLTVDLRRIRSQSADARAHYSSPEGLGIAPGVAIIVGSPLSRAIGNFYLGFNRPAVPTRLFSEFAAAEKWLEGLFPKLAERVA